MKKIFYQFSAFLVMFIVASFGISAQTYTCLGHGTQGCFRSATQNAAAINTIEIFKDGVSIFKKAADGCNNGPNNYNVLSTTPSFTLYGGETYEVNWTFLSNWGNTHNFIGFLDYNSDGDYKDANEHISPEWGVGTGVQVVQGYRNTGNYTEKWTVPCNVTSGTTRIRFRSNIETGFGFQNEASASEAAATGTGYGETEEFTINLVSPTSIISGFNVVDTAYVGTNVTFYNTGNGAVEWDLFDNLSVDGTLDEFSYIFNTTGTYKMKNTAISQCVGKDSSYKSVVIVDPPQGTISDFVADKTEVQLYDIVNLFDLSQYGPVDWRWRVFDTTQNPKVELTEADREFPSTSQNPQFVFYTPGTYTVCLSTYNIYGWSTEKCKVDYLKVNPFTEYDVSSSNPTITVRKGTLYDVGGRFADYSNNSSKFTNFLTVIPCNAKSVELTFTQFKMADDNDKVFIHDGPDISSPALHPDGGFISSEWNAKVPFTVTAKSGAFYIYYETNGSGTDSGFVANWVAEEGNGQPPVADFETDFPKVYNSVKTEFRSTSQNTGGVTEYLWDIDGTFYTTENVEHTFFTDKVYPITLIVKTCLGSDTIIKNVEVITPQDQADIDFTASSRRPELGELVTFDLKNDKANTFLWEIFPNSFIYENGTDENSEEPEIKFTKPGCYTITVTGLNSINPSNTKKTVVKDFYICVVGYCLPSAEYTTTDISISNVSIKDGSTVLIDNNSGSSVGGYTDYTSTVSADLLYGKEYSLSMSRASMVDDWNGKVWIDWNVDGDFDDAGEEVMTQGASSSNKFEVKFRVPSHKDAFEGKSRMRVACGYKSKAPKSCGNLQIGEYEDYTINITRDNDNPYITLTEPTVYVMQVNTSGTSKYVEPGYMGTDPSEGDITDSVIVDLSELEEDKVGFYTITYNVCDQSGNCADQQTRTVKVVKDITAPTIILNNNPVYVDVSEKRACLGTLNVNTFDYSSINAKASDPEDGNLDNLIVYDANSVDINTVGTYTVMFTVRDIQGNMDTAYATVYVQDLVAPDIITDGPDQISIGELWAEQTRACDKYDDNPTLVRIPGKNGFPNSNVKGDYPVTYMAYDADGNYAQTIVRNYRVDDFKAPVIDLHTDDTIYHDVNNKYYSVNATAIDNNTTEVNVIRNGYVDWHTVGLYKETFEASDESNNVGTKIRYVYVVDREAPQISANTLCVKLGTDFWNGYELVITDNYDDPAELKKNVKIVNSNVNTAVEGTYSISYQVEDSSGNKSPIFTRLITVSEKCGVVGIEDLSLEDNIKIYPNPSNGVISIDVQMNGKTVNADVINLLGETVTELGELSTGTNNVKVNVETSGVYFIRFTSGEQTAVKKIVIN